MFLLLRGQPWLWQRWGQLPTLSDPAFYWGLESRGDVARSPSLAPVLGSHIAVMKCMGKGVNGFVTPFLAGSVQ